jgi:hypothetical protein
VCDADLEDELVCSLGAAVVERVIEAEGEWASFQTFQKQPEKQRLTREAQLHGFMWNRKIRYARLLVDALDLAQVPRPLLGPSLRRLDHTLTAEAGRGVISGPF